MQESAKTEQPEKKKPARYTSTLDGSQWSVVKYGIVEYLRAHKFWRATVAVVGMFRPSPPVNRQPTAGLGPFCIAAPEAASRPRTTKLTCIG
jgi:hypothetical protein